MYLNLGWARKVKGTKKGHYLVLCIIKLSTLRLSTSLMPYPVDSLDVMCHIVT
jgi:hypothetical protein